MVRSYIGPNGYYESDGDFGDTPVPKQPSVDHDWDGSAWQFSQARRDARIAAAREEVLAEFDRPVMRRLVKVLAARFGVTTAQLADDLRRAE